MGIVTIVLIVGVVYGVAAAVFWYAYRRKASV